MRARLTALAAVVAAVLATVLALGHATPAHAQWHTSGAGPARQAAVRMPAGPVPTVTMRVDVRLGYVYTLTWPTATLHDGQPVTGYVVSRDRGGALLATGTCAGPTLLGIGLTGYAPTDPAAPTQSCTDVTLTPLGAVRYTITPVYGRWKGTASSWSLTV
ncbi:hypothetical protein [Modestobacter roseus]|uniref:Uncharacterized protein n=1 Tax=Modestobacter roseus TaxID=1181884 RepID=A0A562IVI0_9ACTN|nr:hypothetical protein [Modestobacter roseus]MQA33009.1 hypothetical protein [Modestobacter roseus]TWH74534.1 hypothetical protein JD78_03074 [Modestobacter roseus]